MSEPNPNKPIIYISGPITGKENSFEIFKEAEEKIKALGFIVENPHTICQELDIKVFDNNVDKHWQACMRLCIMSLMASSAIVTLDGWEKSKGANTEVELARRLDIPVLHILKFMDKHGSNGTASN